MAYAKFKAHKFSLLNINNIGSDYVLKGSECGLACVNIPSCFSFNLAAFSDIMSGKILCELLPSDIYNNSKNFVASQFHHHYSIQVSWKWTWKLKHFFPIWKSFESTHARQVITKQRARIKLYFVLCPGILMTLIKCWNCMDHSVLSNFKTNYNIHIIFFSPMKQLSPFRSLVERNKE